MAFYSVAVNRAGVNTANTVLAEIRASASARVFIREIQIWMATLPTAQPQFVLARSTNTPAGGTAVAAIGHDGGDGSALTTFYTTGQTTVPTFATAGPWAKVGGLPLTLGAGLVWSWPWPA